MTDLARALRLGVALATVWLASGCGGSGGADVRPASDPQGDAVTLVAFADSAIARGDAKAARRALDRAVAAAPDDPLVRLGRGRFYAAIRRYQDAKVEFERAASLDPKSPEPHYQLGLAYLAAGERDQALASLQRARALDPDHAGARAAVAPLLGSRYVAAGIPAEYAQLTERPTLSRGELGVALAVELGADPDRVVWRSDEAVRLDWPEIDAAWGSRWVRAAVARRWILPYADGSLHLDDPVTRGSLALLLARVAVQGAAPAPPPAGRFPDLGPRHYLGHAAERAVGVGLPTREGGRFEPSAAATGHEALLALRGLARALGASPVVSAEP